MDKFLEVYERITNIQRNLDGLSKELLEVKEDFGILYVDKLVEDKD